AVNEELHRAPVHGRGRTHRRVERDRVAVDVLVDLVGQDERRGGAEVGGVGGLLVDRGAAVVEVVAVVVVIGGDGVLAARQGGDRGTGRHAVDDGDPVAEVEAVHQELHRPAVHRAVGGGDVGREGHRLPRRGGQRRGAEYGVRLRRRGVLLLVF